MRVRKLLAVALPLLVVSLLSASCSSDKPSAASEPTPTPTSGTSGDAAFPVTVPHKSSARTRSAAHRPAAYRGSRRRRASVLSDAGRHRRLG